MRFNRSPVPASGTRQPWRRDAIFEGKAGVIWVEDDGTAVLKIPEHVVIPPGYELVTELDSRTFTGRYQVVPRQTFKSRWLRFWHPWRPR